MDILVQNISNTNLVEYGLKMNEKLGKKRVDKMYYQQIINFYKNFININLKNHLENNWNNYCYIEKNVEFERPEEWAVHYSNEIGMQNDGFRLEYIGEIDNFDINKEEYKLTLKQKENIFEALTRNSNLHKVTFFEADNILNIIISKNNLKEQPQTEQQQQTQIHSKDEIQTEFVKNIPQTSTSSIDEEQNIYKRIKSELKKVTLCISNFHLKIFEYF
ncbi:unnamed protein product [Meloidogyne enterolobii]|uniref:Uncharacterized protein n=1 Tax=Meloidogyne enterolobii TaxID=390850 RepID=A0ACB0ZRJ5_MELEN